MDRKGLGVLLSPSLDLLCTTKLHLIRKVLVQLSMGPGVQSQCKIVAVSTCVEVVLSAVELIFSGCNICYLYSIYKNYRHYTVVRHPMPITDFGTLVLDT